MKRALPIAVALLAGCPDAPLAPPAEPATAPPAITAWLGCAAGLGFEATDLRATGPSRAEIAIRVPAGVRRGTPEAQALSWLAAGRGHGWRLTLGAGSDGTLTLEDLAPGSFLDAQGLLAVAHRCGPLQVGDRLARAYAEGPAQAPLTRGAARLVIAACEAGPSCPTGWRARLLDLAAVHPDAAAPRRDGICGAPRPPPDSGLSTARSLHEWVLDELGPAPDQSLVDWAKALSERALGGGEAVIRPRFDALREAGDDDDAAELVDEAVAAGLGLSERLRFDGALAWRAAGDVDAARTRLTALAEHGRTAYAEFARRELSGR